MYKYFWKPLEKDQRDAVECEVRGTIPSWLTGTLFRNGPGKYEFGEEQYNHLFDGAAVLHKFVFNEGKVIYQNRLLDTDTYRSNMAANRIVIGEFGTAVAPDPCKNLLNRYFTHFSRKMEQTDNTNVNVVEFCDQIYALTETPYMNRIDPEKLVATKKVELDKLISVNLSTAHPHFEPDGSMINFGVQFGKSSNYHVIKIPPIDKECTDSIDYAERIATLPVLTSPTYFHSFGMTENYIIFIEQPYYLNILSILSTRVTNKSYQDCYEWRQGIKNVFHVINKETKEVSQVKYVSDPFFFFHLINAYEDENHIVIDAICYPDDKIVNAFFLANLRQGPHVEGYENFPAPDVRRYVLPLNVPEGVPEGAKENLVSIDSRAFAKKKDNTTIFLAPERFAHASFEMPRINYDSYNTKKYRYAYGANMRKSEMNELVKIDWLTKKVNRWYENEDWIVGEPVFIPKPNPTAEDDGVVLSPVISSLPGESAFLLVLDATSFTELARAEIPSDVHVPLNFHGNFVKKCYPAPPSSSV
ncbi:DgyrCDS1993 [Dimorphilus gyrociliatus]|uniref:DgyrCDS1993 n=1 Tax=Dimorphilus gyrociliatus TaxID=2664684 RepID=A0A7I8VAA6_9ANNE|nr:DgyrCDS1993 [Dimorphilus gyrociliatus]